MLQWSEITTLDKWNEAYESSTEKPFILLKHSTACPVSASALEEYEAYLADHPKQTIKYYLVKVIESRPVSNQIADDLQVKHASPQMIYVKDKAAYWNTSHWSVTAKHISAVLE